MVDSSSVLTSSSSIKQPLLLDDAVDSSSPSHQTRAEIIRQYKKRVEKSRLAAAANLSPSNSCAAITSDVEDRQGVISYDTSLLIAPTSDTASITNVPTSMTSAEQQHTRSQSLQSQSLDEPIIVPIAKTFPLPNNSLDEQTQRRQPMQSPILPPKPQSAWSDSHRKGGDRWNTPRTPPSKPPRRESEHKTKFKRSHTHDFSTLSTVVDDALMDRAFYIRENLRKYEMLELAAEAERAAESGMEKFVGSASKYVEESPDQTYSERKEFAGSDIHHIVTPQRSRGLLELDPLEFTPSSYFNSNTKKIKVSSLRKFSDVVPNFKDMHSNIRFHLQRSGVDVSTLPEMGSRVPLVKNDTVESDAHSQALSVTGSIGSFSTYAASSIKGVVDLLGRSRSNQSNKNEPKDFSIIHKSSSAVSSFEAESPVKQLWESAEEDERSDLIKTKRHPPLFPPSLQTTRSTDRGGKRNVERRRIPPLVNSKSDTNNLDTESYDSDDSSVELYGRRSKSPLNMSLEDNVNQKNQLEPALSRSRSAQALPSLDNSHQGASRSKISFEEPLGCRSCSPEMPLLEKCQTIESVDETGAVRSLLDRIQQRFSVSMDECKRDDLRNPLKNEEENKIFLSNYFYTEKDAETRDGANLKIDINHTGNDNDAFCVGYCADDDTRLVSSCETLGKFVASALDWVSTKKSDSTVFTNSTVFSNRNRSESAPAFSNLYTDNGHDREKRVFAPPRLSERCGMNSKFASDGDLMQPKNHNESITDCSENIVCDGFDFKEENN
eukprot:scaffold26656_cov149-Skeletonema_menzelii.AAC.13